ncbi:hypothetical protein Bcsk_004930 [Bartonella sp. CDC_skunk]|uniref:hypothetical protein n=1 Tax=Bartonella sp. CDC_skunk TaxID=1933905 RepID=UPI0009C273D1|nr:hypothetical protein [Bartonella sp. CDC_skunk]AQX21151.1 hypothetical protein Bcsk_004930 [Bartonella sp. CDC_skunk]
MRNRILKKFNTRICRLIGCHTKIEDGDRRIEEFKWIPNRERSIENLMKRHTTHTKILAKQEEWHKSKFDSWMRWHEATLAERDKSIEQQQIVLENLSTLIKQKNKTLYEQRLKLASQMELIDKLNNEIIFLINKKEEPGLLDFAFAGECF